MVLLVTPPFTQLNTPYPATTQLKAFLDKNGFPTKQVDLGIELIDRIFSSDFLLANLPKGLPDVEGYTTTIDAVKRFLRGSDLSLAQRIVAGNFLPKEVQHSNCTEEEFEWAFGVAGVEDRARYIATLYLEDLAEMLKSHVDPHFELVRYAEHLCTYAADFDGVGEALAAEPTALERVMLELMDAHIRRLNPEMVCFSVPFPGCLLSTLRCGHYIKEHYPAVAVCMGGGFVNTELRQLSEPRIFDYVDYITLDDGELPLLRLLRYRQGEIGADMLLRTYYREDGLVRYVSFVSDDMPAQVENDHLPVPDFDGLPLDLYLSTADMTNPMQSLWSCGRWNKMMMAHGCYWAKCAFCDTTLDYIGRYDAPKASTVVDRMERIVSQTGCSGFHFVDEALPPKLLREVCEEIVRRRLVLSFWGNIRFEKTFNAEYCQLLAEAGCIAVSGGLEVASDRLLRLIGKGVSVQQTIVAARNLSAAGIMVHTYLMYGFPTETLNETIEALENVRRMFNEGIVQSAFWHRYAMTVHSPSGHEPEKYGARCPEHGRMNRFCNNEIPFDADFDYDLDAVGDILRIATYNYMNGLALDRPASKWFKSIIRSRTR
ncbi:MAG: radical SAM protein [Bacteroidales bacterium]|nr:radical SAM protein [Bacteroidales bacterium]